MKEMQDAGRVFQRVGGTSPRQRKKKSAHLVLQRNAEDSREPGQERRIESPRSGEGEAIYSDQNQRR